MTGSKSLAEPMPAHLVTMVPGFISTRGGRVGLAQVSVTGGETVLIPTPFENFYRLGHFSEPVRASSWELFGLTNGRYPLWVLPVLGGSPRRLGDLLARMRTWSPDGQKILYAHGPDLYLAKSDGTETRKLVTAGRRPLFLRWSPDGSKAAFTLYRPRNQYPSSLWEVSADGTNLHPLLPGWNNPPEECCGNWTPDGKYFCFPVPPRAA